MQKKILKILLIGFILFGLVGCKNDDNKKIDLKDSKAEIIDGNDKKSNLSYNEIQEIINSNEAKFEQEYEGSQIKFQGTLKSVKTNVTCPNSEAVCNKVEFEEGWTLYVLDDISKDVLATLNKSDQLVVETGLWKEYLGCYSVFDTSPVDCTTLTKK